MKLSFLVTCHNETDTLKRLLSLLSSKLIELDAELVILDDYSDNPETLTILDDYKDNVYKHSLDNNFGAHKNFGKSFCKGEFIFQLDGDESVRECLMDNLLDIINSNPNTELYWIPRINDFKGATEEHAKKWGWSVTKWYDTIIFQWPDYQTRLFKNVPHIKWVKKLHERLTGELTYAVLPPDFDLAIYHDKTIEQQEKSNEFYNKNFTSDENKGISK